MSEGDKTRMHDNDGPTMERVSDVLYKIEQGQLIPKPYFQRRLVWVDSVKEAFIVTVLEGYPFPEIFVATGQLAPDSLKRVNWLVDGQQRITTLNQYYRGEFKGRSKGFKSFVELTPDAKIAFLDYKIAVRDLGIIDEAQIREIFKRINSTDYALKPMERLHAVYGGKFIDFCVELTANPFFTSRNVFNMSAVKRMKDVAFCVTLVATVSSGYFRRQEENERFLKDFMNDYPEQHAMSEGFRQVFAYVIDLSIPDKSRVWNTTDLFTLLVEVFYALIVKKNIAPCTIAGPKLIDFYNRVQTLSDSGGKKALDDIHESKADPIAFRYLKAATKASDDKYARVTRAEVISPLLVPELSPDAPTSQEESYRPRKGKP